jgi:hypothetical protein
MKSVINFLRVRQLSTVHCQLSIFKTLAAGFILAATVVTSCKKDNEAPALSVDTSVIEALAVAGTYTVAVKSDGDWTAVVTTPDASWCTVSPAAGTGNGAVTVTVAVNATAAAKTATITIAQGGASQTITVTANGGEIFADSRGNQVIVPGGAMAFATRVVSFTHGEPWTSDAKAMTPNEILGASNYTTATDDHYICLGSGGTIVVEFGCFITDGEGLDIYVFEIGPDVEATRVEVSNDLQNWIHVGDAAGSRSGVDINGKVPAGAKYQYVRLTDLKTYPHTTWAGADVDAVAILYPVKK